MANNANVIKKIREKLGDDNPSNSNCALIFAYNGTGKTRLSYDFAHYERGDESPNHTLYYNAYTEDLFSWNNEDSTEHRFLINKYSQLIQGLAGYNFSNSMHKYLDVFTDIDFDFHYDKDEIPEYVTFNKKVKEQVMLNGTPNVIEDEVTGIKISRGEERLFVWCFFRCILDQVLGENVAFKDIEYIYIDDPMSSLDDNNVIAFAVQLYSVIRKQRDDELKAIKEGKEVRHIKFVVSSHHALFFHTMLHGLSDSRNQCCCFYLNRNKQTDELVLKEMDNGNPFYYNVAMMSEIEKAINNIDGRQLYTYHFTILRSVMEKIKEFFGHRDFRYILDGITYNGYKFDETAFSKGELTDLYSRMVNVLTHQGSMFNPSLMNEDNKARAKELFYFLKIKYRFQLPDLDDERRERDIHKAGN